MYFPSLLSHAAELFRIIVKSPHPPDATASEYLRSKKYIGSKERKFISAATFAALRLKLLAEKGAESGWQTAANAPPPELGALLCACLIGEESGAWKPEALLFPAAYRDGEILNIRELCALTVVERCSFSVESAGAWVESAGKFLHTAIAADDAGEITDEAAQSVAMPQWILEDWAEAVGANGAIRRARAMLPSARVGLRVNSMMISREKARAELEKLGIASRPGALSPDALLLDERVNIMQTPLYLSGAIEVQDEGSQIIGYAAAPRPGDTILDACAGAGGKSLHLAALQRDGGRIIASDADPRRLRAITSRAERCGIGSIAVDSSFARAGEAKRHFDLVVVDAPCSGIGTVRRTPTIKWRLTADSLKKISRKQAGILRHYAQFVRSGGILLYATCSLMTEENEKIAVEFLRDSPEFAPDDMREVFAKNGVEIAGVRAGEYTCTLSPDIHGTDGFFMARFVRR